MRIDLVFIYLIDRIIYRVTAFFVHWYSHTFLILSAGIKKILNNLSGFLSFKKSLNLPLRAAITLLEAIIYFITIAAAAVFYVVWAFLPFWLVVRIWYTP